jgi:rhodanese-related sulfurtransferase
MASRGVTADELAGRLYDSLTQKLLPLPDDTIVYPGHGAGSMCGKSLSAETWSTMGAQRADNYALRPMERDDFVRLVTADQPTAPAYFAHDAEYNRRVRETLDDAVERAVRPLSLDDTLCQQAEGANILDTRSADAFTSAHLRGAVHVALDGRFASWAGTVLEQDRPVVLIAAEGREREAAVRLGRIGYDQVVGYLPDVDAALRERPDLAVSFGRYTPESLAARMETDPAPFLLDIRGSGERTEGYIAGSVHIPLDQLLDRLDEIPRDREVIALCASGYRSTIASSLIRREGAGEPADLAGGVGGWKKAGRPLSGVPSTAGAAS